MEKSFLKINFIGVNFEAGNGTREKIWSDFVAEQNEEWSEKRVVFRSYRCFLYSEKLRCEKILSEQNFLFMCGILKQFFFSFFLVKRFGYDFVILGWFWQWFEGFENSFRFYANAEVFLFIC